MSKKILALFLVLMLSISVLAGCAQEPAEEAPQEEPQESEQGEETPKEEAGADLKVGFVTDTGGIDDKSFNQGTWEGILKYAEENNWEEGNQYKYIQSNDEADYIPNLSAFGDDNYDLVIAAGFKFFDSLSEVAPQYPDMNFVIIDSVVEQPNVASVVFAEEQGSFLVGVAAAKATKTGKVGFVGGEDFDLIRKFHAGFVAGVKSVDKDIEVLDQYAGSFGEPGKGQQIASTLYEKGVDIIYHAAGGTGNGVINEAKNRVENGEEVWVIGVDKNQYEDGKIASGESVILTSMMKRVDVAAYNVIDALANDNFPGGEVTALTLAEDGVGIPKENPNLSEDIVNSVNEYKERIVNGEIEVPATMDDLKSFVENL